MIRTAAVLVVVAACFVGTLSAAGCEPSCVDTSSPFGPKKCYPPTTMVEDPMNCTQYYFCLTNCETTQVPLPCEPGEMFDPETLACVPGTDCVPSCKPGTCHLTCNGTGDMISDISDCGKYYICYPHGIEGPFSCGADAPFFNGETCVVDDTDCCQDQCSPWCETLGVQVPDPTDCTKYYICIEEGVIPGEEVHFTCNDGENFDLTAGRCSPTAECSVLCSDSGGGGGSSSGPAVTTSAGGSTAAQTTAGADSTTAAVTPTSECQDSLTCTASGNFPKCITCQPDYFHCTAAGQAGETRSCSGGLVFNTDPAFPYCIQPTNCPYTPPF